MMYGTEAMMKFRTAYLQAISRSWRSEAYLAQFLADPEEKLQELGFENPWSVDISMDATQRGTWTPVKAGGWIGPDALISVWLPPPPDDKKYYAEAWAKYYDEFPSFLGTAGEDPSQTPSVSSEETPVVKAAYPLGMGQWSDFLEFGAVTMRFIAMAWGDAKLRKELDQAAVSVGKVKIVEDAIPLLHRWVGYNVPWNMRIQFKMQDWITPCDHQSGTCCCFSPGTDKSSPGFWRCPGREGNSDKRRPVSCSNEIKLYVPSKPSTDDGAIDAIALSAYNVTGDQYPFTCP